MLVPTFFLTVKYLKIANICALLEYKFCFDLINGLNPKLFADIIIPGAITINDHDTRQATDLRMPAVRHDIARNGIKYKFPFIFNNMPDNFKYI